MSIIVVCVSKHAEYVNNICQMHCSLSADGHANGGGHPNGAQMGKNTKKTVNKKCRVSWCNHQNMHNVFIIFVQCIRVSMPMGTQVWKQTSRVEYRGISMKIEHNMSITYVACIVSAVPLATDAGLFFTFVYGGKKKIVRYSYCTETINQYIIFAA